MARLWFPSDGIACTFNDFSLWVILRPDFSVEFNPSLEKVSFNRKNIITLLIFIGMAIMLLFSSLLNPWISAFLELPKKSKTLIR